MAAIQRQRSIAGITSCAFRGAGNPAGGRRTIVDLAVHHALFRVRASRRPDIAYTAPEEARRRSRKLASVLWS